MTEGTKIITASFLAVFLGAVVAALTPWWAMPIVVLGVAGLAYLGVVAAMLGTVLTDDPQTGRRGPRSMFRDLLTALATTLAAGLWWLALWLWGWGL